MTILPSSSSTFQVQERAVELEEHEESLEVWKRQFKAQALRQIGERERTLAEWQAKLDARDTELTAEKSVAEVRIRVLLSRRRAYG